MPSGPSNGKGTTGGQNEPGSEGIAHLVFQFAQRRRRNEVPAAVDQDRPRQGADDEPRTARYGEEAATSQTHTAQR